MVSPLVSVIVPTKNSERTIKTCLNSIRNQSYSTIEIIVVDNNSADRTKEISFQFTRDVFDKGPERSAQRNYGAQRAKGGYLLFIDSDMKLSENVILDCVRKMQENQNLKAIAIPEESFGEGFWAQCKKLERSFYIGVDWMEAARFFRREVFMEMGGYNESLVGGDDYDLAQGIETRYGDQSIGHIDDLIYHNEQRLSLKRICGKKFYYGGTLDAYRSVKTNVNKFAKQSSVGLRYRLFFSNPKKLLQNPLIGWGMLFMKTCEFGALGLGYLTSRVRRKVIKQQRTAWEYEV